MSKHKFTIAEEWAVYSVLGPKCQWSGEPVTFDDAETDHVIPEWVEKKPEELKRLIKLYKLPVDFEINSFANWIPVKSKRNKTKSGKTFDGAPFVGELLHKVGKVVPKVRRAHDKFVAELAGNKAKAVLQHLMDDGHDLPSMLSEILNSSVDVETNDIVVLLSEHFGVHPLNEGWSIVNETGEQYGVAKDGKFGFTPKDPVTADLSWVCENCLRWGPWDGNRCQSCGIMSQPL